MPARIIIGCCGWSYLRPAAFQAALNRPYTSVLQAYAQLFGAVEVNSTFYRIPKPATAEKWRREVEDPGFVFTVKAYRGITHVSRFGSDALGQLSSTCQIARILNSPVVLFQTPASFKPSGVNIAKMKTFFARAEQGRSMFAWEPRGTWFDDVPAIADVCVESRLAVCVDPFRQDPIFPWDQSTAYFRLHGFGKPSMYRYDFSESELERLTRMIAALPPTVSRAYVFFNNVSCYENARQFSARVIRHPSGHS